MTPMSPAGQLLSHLGKAQRAPRGDVGVGLRDLFRMVRILQQGEGGLE